MRDVFCGRLATGLLAGVAVCTWLSPGTALAHKMYIFARFHADEIGGKVYFRGNAPAEGVTVEAFTPAGQKVGQARTDAQGQFTLAVRSESDLKLIATTDDGHAAEPYTLTAADRAEQSAVVDLLPQQSQPEPAGSQTPSSPPHQPAATPGQERLETAIEAAVSRQVSPLRRQIAVLQEEVQDQIAEFQGQMQDQITFRDYVGGIGYIAGLTGLAFYFLGIRRRTARFPGPVTEREKAPNQQPAGVGRSEEQ